MAKGSFSFFHRVLSGLLRPVGINMDRRLLVSLEDQTTSGLLARYVILGSANRVLASGECEPRQLPSSVNALVSFYSSGAYFEQAELEVRKLSSLPFMVRRHVADSLVFNESFRVRYAQKKVGPEHYWIDMLAADESLLREITNELPMRSTPFTRLALVESAIASFVGSKTDEPARVFWMRSGVMLGLLVEQGQIIGRAIDYSAITMDDDELASRMAQLSEAVDVAGRRAFAGREVILALELGELAGRNVIRSERGSAPSLKLEQQLSKSFSGAEEGHVLRNPELYGLAYVSGCYSLLEKTYEVEAQANIYANALGRVLFVCGLLVSLVAANAVYEWHSEENRFVDQNAKLGSAYAALKSRIPSKEQLEVLTRLYSQSKSAQFRSDAFLAWISHITPEGVIIRNLEISERGDKGLFAIKVEWELSANYTDAEVQVARLLIDLGKRTTLSNSKLERKLGGGTLFSADLTPSESAFRG